MRLILESRLRSGLKLTALALARYAETKGEDGIRTWASVRTLSEHTGKPPRQVTREITELVRLGVLVPLTPRQVGPREAGVHVGSSGKATRYRVDEAALDRLEEPRRLPRGRASRSKSRPDEDVPTLVKFDRGQADDTPVKNDMGQGTETPPIGDADPCQKPPAPSSNLTETPVENDRGTPVKYDTRSCTDQDLTGGNRTAAPPPLEPTRTKTAQAKEPNGNNFKVVSKIAWTLIAERSFETYGDFVFETKQRCADLIVDYGRHPDVDRNVVEKACLFPWNARPR